MAIVQTIDAGAPIAARRSPELGNVMLSGRVTLDHLITRFTIRAEPPNSSIATLPVQYYTSDDRFH